MGVRSPGSCGSPDGMVKISWWEDFTSVMVHEQLRYSCSAEEMSGGETMRFFDKMTAGYWITGCFFRGQMIFSFWRWGFGEKCSRCFCGDALFCPDNLAKIGANCLQIKYGESNHFDIQKEIRPNSNFPFQKVCHMGSVLSFSQLRMSNFPSNLRNSSPKLDTPWWIFLGSELRQGNVSKHSLKMVSETQILLYR